jgi:hypothetical protein
VLLVIHGRGRGCLTSAWDRARFGKAVAFRDNDIRGDNDGGREMVDSAGVVDGVSVDDDVNGTE